VKYLFDLDPKNRGISPPHPGEGTEDQRDYRVISTIEVGEALEEATERAMIDKRRREAIKGLVQSFNYLLATLGDMKLEQSISTGENPLEWNVKVYWKEKEKKKWQRKLTDFL